MSAVNSIKPKTDIPQSIQSTSPTGDTAGIDAAYQAATIPSWSKPSEYALADHMSKHGSAISRTDADRALKKVMGQIIRQGQTNAKATDDENEKEQIHDEIVKEKIMQDDIHQKNKTKQSLQDQINQDIAQAKKTADDHSISSPTLKVDDIKMANLEKIDPQQMVMMATLLGISTFSATADATIKATDIMTKTQEVLRDQKVKKLQDKMAQQSAQAKKAHKAGIWTALFDWVISAAEAIYGIVKLVEGAARIILSAGADVNAYMEVAAGGTYLAAGVAGFVKAAAETAELSPHLSEAQKKKCEEVAKYAGFVQLGFEAAGLIVDVVQGGLAFKAARGAVKGIKTGVEAAAPKLVEGIADVAAKSAEDGASEAVELSITEAKQALKEMSKEIAKEVSEKLGDSIAENVTSKAFKEAVENSGSTVVKKTMSSVSDSTKHFGEKAIKDMTEKVVNKVVKRAIKKAIKEGVEISADDLVKSAGRWATWELMKKAASIGVKVGIHMLQGAVGGGRTITVGTIKEIKRKTEEAVERLMLDTEFLEYTYDWYERTKNDEVKAAKGLMQKETTSLQGATQTITETGSIQSRVASSLI
ncbi:hypothetical protein D5R81_11250 [Parashewanella spongiae]|uniref:Translocator protein BipB-like C-terminal domain-containing protein n=1 Tax=Parashewanella spongiae TaxID=342950 RepID=A0A3A6TDE7_9GAMM|nr:type III secretion system translocon subunit SctE [Parashewanella spongiae]MCL1078522.1 type III secretion system translocon subunit SctE [Parashewanella spongiae]RJY13459.1 hypothetical protein D5R81_11250 [Parashewanella spongiae]